MKKISFYRVSEDYINYLKNYEIEVRGFTKVPDIKYADKDKFTFGTVLMINDIKYYVSVSSFKKKQEANILIRVPGDHEEVKGTLRFNFMIPVPDDCIKELVIAEEKDKKYRVLLDKEYNFCVNNYDRINKKAMNIYRKVINQTNQRLSDNSCDFALLEEAYKAYIAREEAAVTNE